MAADAATPCPTCGAATGGGDAFCGSCGASLESPRRRREPSATAQQKARDRAEFARTKNTALYLRSIYWVQLLAVLLLSLPTMLADEVSPLLVITLGGIAATMLAGALLVLRAPLVWSLVVAALSTVDLLLKLQALALGLWLVLPATMTLLLWAAVLQAARLQRLMAADPSLQIVRRRIDASRRVEGGVADAARQRRRQTNRKAWRTRLRLLGFAAAGLVVVVVGIVLLLQPESPTTAVARFARGWQDHDAEVLAAACATPGVAASLRTDLARRGWSASPPPLGESTVEVGGSGVIATFAVDGGELRTRWLLERTHKQWRLTGYTLPALRAPAPGPAAENFRTAWSQPGTAPLFATLQDSLRTLRGESIRGVLEHRGWLDQRPPLGPAAVEDRGDGDARARFACGEGELSVRLSYHHPDWWVAGIVFPRDE